MGEPESLATDEALTAHIARHAYDRLIMLSDGIFAIATTLAALEIKLPHGIRDPVEALIAIRRPLAAYAISFAVIAVFWLSSRDLFARVGRVTRTLTTLTLAMLFTVSLIPLGVAGIAVVAIGPAAIDTPASESSAGVAGRKNLRPSSCSADPRPRNPVGLGRRPSR